MTKSADEVIQEALDKIEEHAKVWGKEDAAGTFMQALLIGLKATATNAKLISEHLSKGGLEKIAEQAAEGAKRGTWRLGYALDRRTHAIQYTSFAALLVLAITLTFWWTWREADHWDTSVRVGLTNTLNMSTADAALWLRLIRSNPNIIKQKEACEPASYTAQTGQRVCALYVYLEPDPPGLPVQKVTRR